MAISTVTSEALQLKLRQLLPSQQGFGTDLSASDTIIPIIDLTLAAEGSDVPVQLQEAFFAGQTSVEQIDAGTQTIINNTGFYRLTYQMNARNGSPTNKLSIRMNDGSSTTDLVVFYEETSPAGYGYNGNLTVFLSSGDSVEIFSDFSTSYCHVTARQIADINGTLVQPTGFSPS